MMRRSRASAAALACLGLCFIALIASAALEDDKPPPYVGTPPQVVERMLAMANVGKGDMVVDLGSGDGRIVLEAARRFGARALGVELNGALVAASRKAAQDAGLSARASFRQQDIFAADLSEATVLTLYLSPEFNDRLMPRILEMMRPGARVVSHDFPIGLWAPDAVEHLDVPEKNFGRGGQSSIMLFIVPADASGRWRGVIGEGPGSRTVEFSIAQQFQVVEGALHVDGTRERFTRASLKAESITIELGDGRGLQHRGTLTARIHGNRMSGTFRPAGAAATPVPFSAERTQSRPDPF